MTESDLEIDPQLIIINLIPESTPVTTWNIDFKEVIFVPDGYHLI